MKLKKIIFIMLLAISPIINGQITEYDTKVDGAKKTYSTKNYAEKKGLVDSQTYELTQKLKNVKISDQITTDFIVECLNVNVVNSLKAGRSLFIFEYVSDKWGNVSSVSLTYYGNSVQLTSSQILCLLNKSLNEKFTLENKTSTMGNFSIRISKRFSFRG